MLIGRVLCVREHYRVVSAGIMSRLLSGQSVKGVALCLCPDWESGMVWLQCLVAGPGQNLRLSCAQNWNVPGALGLLEQRGQESICVLLPVTCLIPVAYLSVYG